MKSSYLLLEIKLVFNLLDNADFIISDVINKIPNSPAGHQLPTQSKKNVWIIDINGKDPIIYQVAIDELHHHYNQCGKCKVNISLCRRKSYEKTYIKYIWSIFDQVRPVFSHLEVSLPGKTIAAKNIDKDLKGPQIQFCKETLFLKCEKNKNVSLLSATTAIK